MSKVQLSLRVIISFFLVILFSPVQAGGGKSKRKEEQKRIQKILEAEELAKMMNPPSYKHGANCAGCLEEDHALAALEVKNSECDLKRVTNRWRKNCDALFSLGIPKDALRYALNVMKYNDSSFRTRKCIGMTSSGHYSMNGMTKNKFKSVMSKGLKNKCQFIINDIRETVPGKHAKVFRRLYYIDICSDTKPLIKKDYFMLGSGTVDTGRFTNAGGKGTTLLGAFFTNTSHFGFNTYVNSSPAYAKAQRDVALAKMRRRGESEINSKDLDVTAVQLFGLQGTNNTGSQSKKYMHVAPEGPTLGCVGVRPENYWMIENLAKNGPSLLLNYLPGLEDISKCSY